MPHWITEPWPWYVLGPLMGLMVPLLLLIGNRQLGISATLRHLCAASLPKRSEYFRYDWKRDVWNLVIAAGIMIGGFVSAHYLVGPAPVSIAPATEQALYIMGVNDTHHLQPQDLYSWSSLWSLRGFIVIVIGGFLVGFGTRYANGCTSGHGLMGLALNSKASLITVISFFAAGILTARFIVPFILAL